MLFSCGEDDTITISLDTLTFWTRTVNDGGCDSAIVYSVDGTLERTGATTLVCTPCKATRQQFGIIASGPPVDISAGRPYTLELQGPENDPTGLVTSTGESYPRVPVSDDDCPSE